MIVMHDLAIRTGSGNPLGRLARTVATRSEYRIEQTTSR